MADRGEPWFDYRAFAESLGPDDPVRFSWTQSYGPIDWPRNGNEVMRVTSVEPLYWKARNLDVFDGTAWTVRDGPAENPRRRRAVRGRPARGLGDTAGLDGARSTFSIRRVRTPDVFGAGTIDRASMTRRARCSPGSRRAPGTRRAALRRGDSYTVEVHVPQPTVAAAGGRRRRAIASARTASAAGRCRSSRASGRRSASSAPTTGPADRGRACTSRRATAKGSPSPTYPSVNRAEFRHRRA